MKVLYYIIYYIAYLLSLLPLRVHYVCSDWLLYPFLYYIIRYRRKIVRKNLTDSFPQKGSNEIVQIEKRFYRWLCDYMVETLKLFSISKKQLMQRMTFSGMDDICEKMQQQNKQFCFVYLGHYCNWEWVASLGYWAPEWLHCSQIYHPLYNKVSDKLFLEIRNQYGGECIPMKETLRRILELKRDHQQSIIGFISDQAPKWNSMHHWTNFLHRKTFFFIGTERIGKKVDALVYYADVKRVKRGYYHCEFKLMTDNVKSLSDYDLTDQYATLLEQNICQEPAYWLWSHKRWKRTYEQWVQRQENT